MHATFCIHEDRADCLIGVKLAVLSLQKHYIGWPIVLNTPGAPQSFSDWARSLPNVTLTSFRNPHSSAWNIKPSFLLHLLENGYENIIWIDSDIIACNDILRSIAELDEEVLVATEETYWGQNQGGTLRTVAWGLAVGRVLPCTVNSGVLRVTPRHRDILGAWKAMLLHPLYSRAQSLSWSDRPLHMVTDQEALTGLLGSTKFGLMPLRLIKRGSEIAQCMGPSGFTPTERMRCTFSVGPGLIHAMGLKPWRKPVLPPKIGASPASLRSYYEYLHMELSPYVGAAREYRPFLADDCEWMDSKCRVTRALRGLFRDNPILQEMPASIVDAVTRQGRKTLNIARYKIPLEYQLTETQF